MAPLGPGFYCVRFAPSPLNPRTAPPVCVEKAYPSPEEASSITTAVERRRAEEGQADGEGEGAPPLIDVTLLLLARGDAWGANDAGREEERARVAEAVAAWGEGGDVVVVEYRDDASSLSSSSVSFVVKPREGVRVLPFVVPEDGAHRVLPLKAMVNMGLDAVRTRFVLPLDPAKLGASSVFTPSLLPGRLVFVCHPFTASLRRPADRSIPTNERTRHGSVGPRNVRTGAAGASGGAGAGGRRRGGT